MSAQQLAPTVHRKRGLWLGLGGLALAAAGGLTAFFVLRADGSAATRGIDFATLPGDTRSVMLHHQLSAMWTGAQRDLPDYALPISLARWFCDPNAISATPLFNLRKGPPESARRTLTKENLAKIADTLECGRALGSAAEKVPDVLVLVAENDGKSSLVFSSSIPLEAPPANSAYLAHTFSGVKGYCAPSVAKTSNDTSTDAGGAPGGGECSDDSHASVRLEERWYFGTVAEIGALVEVHQRPRKELSSSAEAMQIAWKAIDNQRGTATVGVVDDEKDVRRSLQQWCSNAAELADGEADDLMKWCFPSRSTKQLEAMAAKSRAVLVEIDDAPAGLEKLSLHLGFVTRDDEAAKDAETTLSELARDWRSHVENNKSKIELDARKRRTAAARQWAILVDPFLQSIAGLTVSREGRVVHLRASRALDEVSKKALADVEREEPSINALRAVFASIADRQPPKETDLAKLVGPEWAAELTTPKRTFSRDECVGVVQKNINGVDFGSLPENQRAGYMTTLTDLRVATKDCSLTPTLAESWIECVSKAASPGALSTCTLPKTPSDDRFGKLSLDE